MDDFALAHTEVVRLHDFLGAWFRGELPPEALEQDFARVLDPAFENVQPAGVILSRADIVSGIKSGRGTNPEFQITIEEPRLLGSWPGFVLFKYVEHQTGARASVPENKRLSTVLFERKANNLMWRYLTEVGLEIG